MGVVTNTRDAVRQVQIMCGITIAVVSSVFKFGATCGRL